MIVKIYIVIWNDRHTDPTADVFSDKDAAINWARDNAKKSCRHKEDYEEKDIGRDQGWVFYASYSCESDCIWVVESEIDQKLKLEVMIDNAVSQL